MPAKPRNSRGALLIVDAAAREDAVVKSAARALRILEFFDDVQREARLTEISRRLGLPPSSTSVLLHSLVQLGYLSHDRTQRTFKPTLRVGMLGSWTTRASAEDGSFARMLQELSAGTGETISIAARNGIYAQYIRVVQATNALRIHVPTGTRRLLVWSASGFALLSEADEREIAALVRRTNAEHRSGRDRIELRRVLENVDRMRRQGYFFSRNLVTPGGGHIAMRFPPTGPEPQDQVYALGVAGWVDRIARNEKRIIRLMRHALRRL
ncbi:IclR family transcriptional regulator [Reyranella sp.]|uniref:IclR family transcriptional regulator n=1 Tax=Reyranella sp. TaxID=1929291 RepID=UPI003BAAC7A2